MKRIIIALDPETLDVSVLREAVLKIKPHSIPEARKRLGLSQEDLAKWSGCTRVYVSMIERGVANDISLKIARRIARALHCTVDQLFPEES